MIAGWPLEQPDPPRAVRERAAGRTVHCVWENQLGGLTFRIEDADGVPVEYVKWAPAGSGLDLAKEAGRLRWAAARTTVPRVVDLLGDDDGSTCLITAPIAGDSAVAPMWLAQPERAVTAIGRGLRQLHDVLDPADCPFSWSVEDRLRDVRRLVADGTRAEPSGWNEDHQHLALDDVLGVLASPPPVDRLVVCHGDACAPNTLVAPDGSVAGHVDLGSLGVADRWADLAIATWSTGWNYGPGWEDVLLDAYGIASDPDRTRYYRLLWDLGP